MNHIEFYTKSVYGNTHEYVADADQAACIRKLTGMKTLQPEHKEALAELGFTFKEVLAPKEVEK